MADGVHRVRLAQVPADLVMRERDHLDSLMRELYGSELLDHDSSQVAGKLAGLMDRVLTNAAPVRDACWSAARSGDQVTVDAEVTPSQAQALDGILIVLEQAEAFCLEERLYARPAPADVAELRAWMAAEVRRQLAGAAPSPCPVRHTGRPVESARPAEATGGVATLARPEPVAVEPRMDQPAPIRERAPAPVVPIRVVEHEAAPDAPTSASEPAPAETAEPPRPSSWWDR